MACHRLLAGGKLGQTQLREPEFTKSGHLALFLMEPERGSEASVLLSNSGNCSIKTGRLSAHVVLITALLAETASWALVSGWQAWHLPQHVAFHST